MFPILYESIERNISASQAPKLIVPQHHGLGTLSDCVSCEVEQSRNGAYELTMEYRVSGIHASEIANRRILKVKPNFTDPPQLFRIDRIGKSMNGTFMVYAKHISYDISGYLITGGNAINAAKACELLREATNEDFYIHTTKQVTADFSITQPSSVRSWFAGKVGSFLDVFGTAEIKYDNFDVLFQTPPNTDRGVTIRYGKNLLELSQEINSSNLYTGVVCYYKTSDASVVGDEVSTGLVLDVPNVLAVDVTSNYQETPTIVQLTNDATAYKNSHNLTIPSNNITLDFVQSGQLTGRVDLCDIVTIYYEALGITRSQAKCIRTKWDCLREKYIETEFGDVKTSLADTIAESTALVDDAKSTADAALSAVGSKKRVFVNQPVPPYDIGDLWMKDGAVYYCSTPRTESIIKQEERASTIEFDSFIAEDFIEMQCWIDADEEGFDDIVIVVSDGDPDPETRVAKIYSIELGETLTQGGTFQISYVYDSELHEYVKKAIHTRTDTTTQEYDISTINIPETLVGHNEVTCSTGDIAIRYYETGFSNADWTLATDYVDSDDMTDAIRYASQLITGGLGGNVIINRNEETGRPYEIVIFKTENPTDEQTLENAKWVWRWNINGLAFSDQGYDAPNDYKTAITYDGKINASMITTGELDAQDAGIQNLTASMFEGQMIQLGGAEMPDGKLIIKDDTDTILIQMDINGLECFGAENNGVIPSVVFDKNGVTGYSNSADMENTAIFWTKEQDFHMKNAVIETQMDIGNMLKFLPFTIKDSNNNVTNQGIAVVANT